LEQALDLSFFRGVPSVPGAALLTVSNRFCLQRVVDCGAFFRAVFVAEDKFMKISRGWIYTLSPGSALFCGPVLVSAQSDTETSTPPAGATSAECPQRSGMNPRNNRTEAGLTATDKNFIHDAAEGGLAEVELGKLAAEKASV